MKPDRLRTGIVGLDERLDGGLLPGTLTVLVGSTGIGKTQFGLQFLNAGLAQEGRRGIIFDMASRGDSQSHAPYCQRMFDWTPRSTDADGTLDLTSFFSSERQHGEYLHVFDYSGRRVTRNDLDEEAWRHWQSQLNAKLRHAIAFLYGNFVQGARRVVIDGVEPVVSPQDSIQFNLFEYVYHQVLRKDPEWVARDLLRESYRQHSASAALHRYDPNRIASLLLCTSHEAMLDDLISRPLDEGDVLSNANTVILLGKVRDQQRIGRAMYISKHRGSACADEIIPFQITRDGVQIE
jgi:KaiC/GvpD/RAD55 family RecA-like ATPase